MRLCVILAGEPAYRACGRSRVTGGAAAAGAAAILTLRSGCGGEVTLSGSGKSAASIGGRSLVWPGVARFAVAASVRPAGRAGAAGNGGGTDTPSLDGKVTEDVAAPSGTGLGGFALETAGGGAVGGSSTATRGAWRSMSGVARSDVAVEPMDFSGAHSNKVATPAVTAETANNPPPIATAMEVRANRRIRDDLESARLAGRHRVFGSADRVWLMPGERWAVNFVHFGCLVPRSERRDIRRPPGSAHLYREPFARRRRFHRRSCTMEPP
jgi:hypothetical protein